MTAILYVPQFAERFGMTRAEYWSDCARKWREGAPGHTDHPAGVASQIAFCEWNAAIERGESRRVTDRLAKVMHRADAVVRDVRAEREAATT